MSAEPKRKIKITVISDVICPWCYIGKKKLEQAMELCGDKFEFQLQCEPYLLKPNTPPEGEAKPQLPPGKPRVSPELYEAAQKYGLEFTGLGDRFPFTPSAHAVVDWAEQFNKHWQLSEAYYKAYFTDGVYLDLDAVVAIAVGLGLDAVKAREAASNAGNIENVQARSKHWRNNDVKGIPCFFMNGVKTYSGAHEPSELAQMFEVVAENYPQ